MKRAPSRSCKKLKDSETKAVPGPLRQSSPTKPGNDFAALVKRVVAIIEDARSRVVRTVNSEMVLA